jgi:hypothetical protein
MTVETPSRPATVSSPSRLVARSSIATADVERARNTLAELAEPTAFEDAGVRVLARLRRFVVGDPAELNSPS